MMIMIIIIIGIVVWNKISRNNKKKKGPGGVEGGRESRGNAI